MPWLALGTTTRELLEGDTVVGSGPDADWRVSTAELAPRHFVVRVRGTAISVEPSSPDIVVALDGNQLLGPADLAAGAVILAGTGRFAYGSERPVMEGVGAAVDESAYLVDGSARVAYLITGRSTSIGRDASNAVVVRDPTASRFHAEVRREAGGFAIYSMGAMGTLLNGRPVERPSMLAEGDSVEIAFAMLRFTRQLPNGIALATRGAPQNDDSTRRPTLESGERVLVDADSPAGRDMRRVQILVGLGVVLAGVLGWALGRRR
jgi:predicted component of type VI protein secretion system